jgi:hypothetical protein
MKKILTLTLIGLPFCSLWAQDAPVPAPVAEPAAPATEEGEARWSDFLPLNKEMAGDADMPLPFGLGVTIYGQEQDMKLNGDISLTAATLLLQGLDPVAYGALTGASSTVTATADKVESDIDTKLVKLDAWVLPFLNVYGVFGEIEGDNKVVNASMINPTSLAATAVVQSAFGNVTYAGDVYGFGAVLAYSKDRWWGTLDYSYTETDLSISTSEIKTHTFSPRIGTTGQVGDFKGAIWIGGMHQDVDERQSGSVSASLPGFGTQTISYEVNQEAEEEWHFLVGGSVNLSEEMDLAIEGGLGDRESFMGSLTYRF